MRIVHVCAWARAFTQFRMPLLRALRQQGCDQLIYCPYEKGHVERIRSEGFNLVTGEVCVRPSLKMAPQMAAMYQFLKQGRFDVLMAHQPMAALVSIPVARLAGVPFIIYSTGGLKYFPRELNAFDVLIKHGELKIIELSDAVFLVNREDEAFLKGICKYAEKAHYVGPMGGCGIDGTRYQPLTRERAKVRVRNDFTLTNKDFVIGYTGRIVWEKGLKDLIDAVVKLRSKCQAMNGIGVLLFGEGKDIEAIKSYAVKTKVDELVRFEGYHFDIADCMAAFDVFVLPSYREGLSVSLLEAMALGIPSVATGIRGSRELIEAGKTGLLVPPGDSEALMLALRALHDNPEERTRMGERAARSVLASYSQDAVLPRTVELMLTLASQRGIDV